jgi:programmed cell death protein 5
MSTSSQQDDERQRKERAAVREQTLRVLLSPEARQRLTNIRIVRPELAGAIEEQIIRLASAGRINRPLTDDEVRQLLEKVQQPKREFKIKWI